MMHKPDLFLLLCCFWGIGCAPFGNKNIPHQKLDQAQLHQLNGEYNIQGMPHQKWSLYGRNANILLYRNRAKGSLVIEDTLSIDTLNGYFSIAILDKDSLSIAFYQGEKMLRKQILPYKFKKDDGFVYLRNKNTLTSGVPYLFGGLNIKRVRISLTDDNNLLINDAYYTSWGLMVIFGASSKGNQVHEYRRLVP